MDFLSVLSRLNALPSTFRRNSAPYTQIMDSLAWGVSLFTDTSDSTLSQVQTYANAVDGWLDVWGLLFGVPRNEDESNAVYSERIRATVQAWVGTLPAIEFWVNAYASGGVVVENANGLGYAITLPPTMTAAQVREFLFSLNRIRPLGVPFSVTQVGSGLFLGTDAFLGMGSLAGAYLTGGTVPVPLPLNATTRNSVPLLPTLLLTDPTLNPSLALT